MKDDAMERLKEIILSGKPGTIILPEEYRESLAYRMLPFPVHIELRFSPYISNQIVWMATEAF